MFIPTTLILALVGGAISRMVACEFSQGVRLSWHQALAFSLRKLASTAGSLLIPVVIVAVLAFVIAMLGWTLGVPLLNIVGALLYGVSIIFSAFAVITVGAYMLGWPLLIPAVACEGTDAVDATQRTLAYVLGRPIHLILYSLLLIVQTIICALIFAVIVAGVEGFIAHASSIFAGDAAKAVASLQASELGTTFRVSAWIVSFWHKALSLILAAFLLCLHFSGSTIRYLLLRRINDGQELDELWMPRMIPGTSAPIDPADAEDEE
jgi:hypothetical protein